MAKVEYPEQINALIGSLKRLPGIGPRSAERIAVWMLQSGKDIAGELAEYIVHAREGVRTCNVCGFFSGEDHCVICEDGTRDGSVICVVEEPTDILPLERTGAYRGQYHVLGGKLSPLDNVTPEDLRISALVARLDDNDVSEVILAVGSDVEGEATANYLAEVLRGREISVTRLAQGLPAGGGLEHADELTLYRALDGRKTI